MPFIWVWLRLTIMKLASRKNIMSINGMISIRARFLGKGDWIRISKSVGSATHGEGNGDFYFRDRSRFKPPASESAERGVVQDRIANALGHRGIGYGAAADINAHHANA